MNSFKTGLIVFFCLILQSCVTQNKQVKQIRLRTGIEMLLDSIIKKSPSNKIYELYFDKLDPHNSNILFYIGPVSLTEKERGSQISSLWHIELDHKIISIYTGLEKYVSVNDPDIKKEKDMNNLDEFYWAIEDRNGKFNCYQLDGAYPFMPFPLKNEEGTFSRPIIKKINK